ncbi:TraR/DksA family transcriptional regulator [Chromobacterium aquaticum]|uniref:TraR/DksA family transcriptional regulator n=1 Tax=Chromobacterium aquaticum TaxID=467180 RepID=A0ABV8ZZI6_9NEIS|nr:TraR/DksA family transcriptional regulator [Chromobacterium aquaticum]MCD5362782.1 TraR/DksA family transcriptional regulator [Chromobacterium aquaticum]
MTDIFDQAQELELRQREQALARQAAQQKTGASLSHCEDCGDAIPDNRQTFAKGCTRCFECQTIHERINAR